MKIAFYTSDKKREQDLALAFKAGALLHGHTVDILPSSAREYDYDYACMVGVKSGDLFHNMKKRGVIPIIFDKGYSRHKRDGWCEYWRASVGAHNPTLTTLTKFEYPSDRFEAMGLEVKPWRDTGNHILICGSSEKYHSFYGTHHPTTYAKKLVARIKEYSNRPIIYRPKPSWKGATPLAGTIYSDSKQPLAEVLRDCHCVVTHGSNASFEAALLGIPSVIVGEAVMRPCSSISLHDIEHPYLGDRDPVFNALGYHQWTNEELASGEAFETIDRWVNG